MVQPVPRPNNPPPPLAPKRMTLSAVVRGRLKKPSRTIIYGPEGVGKSTFGADAPAPIFIGAEDGTAQLDVARFPEPKTWQDILDAVDELRLADHKYETAVVDTLDWAEPLCWDFVCARAKKPDIESFGYGKGYVAALDEWRVLLARLDALRAAKGMNIILVAHSWIKPFKNPAGDDFDRYELKLHNKAAGLVKEWSDAVLFAAYETLTSDTNGRAKGVSTGARLIHTQRTAAWDAKNRYGLPETIPLSWGDFVEAVRAGSPAEPAKLRELIEAVVATLGEKNASDAKKALERAGDDGTKLAQLLDWARGRKVIEEREQMPKEEA